MFANFRRKLRSEVFCLTPGQSFGQRLKCGAGRSLGHTTRAQAGPVLHLSNKFIVFHNILLLIVV
jgi:hypothetical protein